MTPPDQQTSDQEREAFEKWCSQDLGGFPIIREDCGCHYWHYGTEHAWQGWQARAHASNLASSTTDEPSTELKSFLAELGMVIGEALPGVQGSQPWYKAARVAYDHVIAWQAQQPPVEATAEQPVELTWRPMTEHPPEMEPVIAKTKCGTVGIAYVYKLDSEAPQWNFMAMGMNAIGLWDQEAVWMHIPK